MPDTHNCKNFFAHGGNELVIGGKLTLLEGATIEGLTDAMEKIENVPESTATTVAALKENFNTLRAALKTVGFMEADPVEDDDGDDEDDDDGDGNNSGDNGGGSGSGENGGSDSGENGGSGENNGSGGDNSGSGENGGSGSGGENPGGGAAG